MLLRPRHCEKKNLGSNNQILSWHIIEHITGVNCLSLTKFHLTTVLLRIWKQVSIKRNLGIQKSATQFPKILIPTLRNYIVRQFAFFSSFSIPTVLCEWNFWSISLDSINTENLYKILLGVILIKKNLIFGHKPIIWTGSLCDNTETWTRYQSIIYLVRKPRSVVCQ